MSIPDREPGFLRVVRGFDEPVDGASLAVFRTMFGLLLAVFCIHMLRTAYLYDSYVSSSMRFTYLGFDWVKPLPLPGLYVVAGTLLIAALCVACGIFQRVAAATFCVGWTYFFLLEKAYFINHFYLVSLLMFLFAFMPGNGAFTPQWLRYQAATVPSWCLWAMRSMIGIVYFYAGLAKIHCDWFAGEPMRTFLRPYHDLPLFGAAMAHPWAPYAFSWGGLIFDLLLVPGLLWPRTRVLTVLFAAGFHLFNHAVFNIGFFPWLAMAGALLFFPPDWPRRILRRLNVARAASAPTSTPSATRRTNKFKIALLCCFFAVQLIVPFQRFLYPGNQHWTEEGQKFSWLLMMKYKVGDVEFNVVNQDTNERTRIVIRRYMNDRQTLMMLGEPDMLVQFAHHLAKEAHANGIANVAVYADTMVSLNGHPRQRIVPPDFDLASVERSWGHYSFIVPLEGKCWPWNRPD